MNTRSKIATYAFEKLDGVWAVQLFFRNFPYFVQRTNTRKTDPVKHFDYIFSEHFPPLPFSAEVQEQMDLYSEQLWGMSIVYLEAILEHYFIGIIDELDLPNRNYPRQAIKMYILLKEIFNEKYGLVINLTEQTEWQFSEITATRHIWVHKNGIVDDVYLRESALWWNNIEQSESIPKVFEKRPLSEKYIKTNIIFCKSLISQFEENIKSILPDLFIY
jgi:hypothetical protein